MLDRYGYATHEVLNQPRRARRLQCLCGGPAAHRGVRAFGADWADERLRRTGAHGRKRTCPASRHARQTAICRSCGRMIASATASTSSSSIPPVTS